MILLNNEVIIVYQRFAPTVTKLLGVYPDDEWEGKSLIK